MKKLFLLSIFSVFAITTFAQSKLQTGTWRGKLKTSSGNNLPFNFIVSDTAGKKQITVINGAERLKVTDVKTTGDSVFIHMPLFDSEFRLKLDGDNLTGKWIKHVGLKDATMDFVATYNENWRFFKAASAPAYNVSGRWTAIFG